MSENFWDLLEQQTKLVSSGGIVCQAEIQMVMKNFATGIDQEAAFRPVKIGMTKAELEEIKAEAQAIGDGRVDYGYQLRAKRDNAVSGGNPVTWAGDRFFFRSKWQDDKTPVILPNLKKAGVPRLPWEGWARIDFTDDPYKVSLGEAGKTDKDGSGNPRYPQVAYISEIFANEDEARKAIGVAADATTDASVPDEWDAETWKSIHSELYAAKESGQTLKQIADDYNVKVSDVVNALKDYIPL